MVTGGHTQKLDSIDQVLLCQICFNPLVNRKCRILSCLHTFCEDCLENSMFINPGRQIACSICRQYTELPTGQVSDLLLNFNINQVQEMAETLVQTALCSKCCKKKEYIPATLRCITCRRHMCDTCRKQHDRLPGFVLDQMEQIDHDVTGDSEQSCQTHKSTFCLFCRKCKVLLCSQCMTEDLHDSHSDNIQSLGEAMSEMQTSLSDRKRDVIKHLEFVKQKIYVNTRQLENLASVEKDIIQTMVSLKSCIDKSGKDLIKELKENYVVKIEQQKAHLTAIMNRGTSGLKTIEDFEMSKTVQLFDSREFLIRETSEFDNLISGLKNEVEIAMVKFIKQLQVSVIGKLEKTDLPALVGEPDKRDLLIPDDLIKLSKQLSIQAAAKPTFVKRYTMPRVRVNLYNDVPILADGSVVLTGNSNDELLMINHQGDILSRYKPVGGGKIKSIAAFNKTIVCTFDKESTILKLTVAHTKIALTKSHSAPGIKADGVCVDCNGNIILYDKETVTKLDGRDNIMWQEVLTGGCSRVRFGLLNNKQCYIANKWQAEKTQIWNELGEVIGTLKYLPHKHHLGVCDMTVSHRGTFIVTHFCTTCYPDDYRTVTEYGPDGSFIRHLLTTEDEVRRPDRVSCDQQGYMWITDISAEKIYIYKLS